MAPISILQGSALALSHSPELPQLTQCRATAPPVEMLVYSNYLRQGGYVFIGWRVFVVSMQDYAKTTQCHKIRWKGVTWAKTEMIRFWC